MTPSEYYTKKADIRVRDKGLREAEVALRMERNHLLNESHHLDEQMARQISPYQMNERVKITNRDGETKRYEVTEIMIASRASFVGNDDYPEVVEVVFHPLNGRGERTKKTVRGFVPCLTAHFHIDTGERFPDGMHIARA